MALAPPPIYRPADKSKSLPKRVRDSIDIYINGQDCVPRMSLATLTKVISMARAVDAIEMTALEQVQMIIGTLAGVDETTPGIKENLAKVQRVISEIDQDRFPFLEHPGKIPFLFPSHGKERPFGQCSPGYELFSVAGKSRKEYSLATEESPTFSRQLLLLDRMVLDHLEQYYRKAMDRTVIGKKEENPNDQK